MEHLTIRPDRLDRLRSICLALPSAGERQTWGDPIWRIGDRIFAMQKGNYVGGRPSVWFKAGEGGQEVLVDGDPGLFVAPPYVGAKGWVGAYLDRDEIDWDLIAALIEESHRLTAPRRVRSGRR
jgi:predicted DNA-binding protein (MmcQ/YjbR family)